MQIREEVMPHADGSSEGGLLAPGMCRLLGRGTPDRTCERSNRRERTTAPRRAGFHDTRDRCKEHANTQEMFCQSERQEEPHIRNDEQLCVLKVRGLRGLLV